MSWGPVPSSLPPLQASPQCWEPRGRAQRSPPAGPSTQCGREEPARQAEHWPVKELFLGPGLRAGWAGQSGPHIPGA